MSQLASTVVSLCLRTSRKLLLCLSELKKIVLDNDVYVKAAIRHLWLPAIERHLVLA